MKVEEFIKQESFVVVNPDYPVISVENALEAVEMVRAQAIEAFRSFIEDYARESGKTEIFDSAEHYMGVFQEKLEE